MESGQMIHSVEDKFHGGGKKNQEKNKKYYLLNLNVKTRIDDIRTVDDDDDD